MIRTSWPARTAAVVILLSFVLITGPASAAPAAGQNQWVLIGLGDSLTHGTMDATNNTVNTANAYLQRIADSLAQRIPLVFSQPFLEAGKRVTPFQIPTNVGIDGEDSFSIDGLQYYKRAGTATSLPSPGNTADKALPFQFEDVHDAVLYPINVLAGQPVTQIQSAEHILTHLMPGAGLNKAIIVYWVGSNDSSTAALGFGGSNPEFIPYPVEQLKPVMPGISGLVQFGISKGLLSIDSYTPATIDRNLTLLGDFVAQQTSLLTRLVNASSGLQEKHIIVPTLPYYSSVGYLMDSEDMEYYFRKLNPAYTVPASFKRVAPAGQPITNPLLGDRVSLLTFGFMYALLDSGYSPAYVNGVLETNGVQRDGLVISEAEQQTIRTRIDGFNAALRSVASTLGPDVHVIPVGEYLNDVLTGQTKVVVGGKEFSRKWVRGSSFTFDGVHPGYVGQSLIANLIIGEMNKILDIDAPLVSLETVFNTDPYIDHDNDGFSPGPNYPTSALAELLFLFKDPDDSNAAIQADIPPDVWDIMAKAIIEEITGISLPLRNEALRRGLLR